MKIENQVTSLELSKRLCELGIPQESLFVWIRKFPIDDYMIIGSNWREDVFWRNEIKTIGEYSAFTVAELGLPRGYFTEKVADHYGSFSREQDSFGNNRITLIIGTEAETEADSRAKMRVYLIENKLI